MNFRRSLRNYKEAPITHAVVMEMLSEYNRPNDKISELLRSGQLTALRRGLYVAGPESDLPIPNALLFGKN